MMISRFVVSFAWLVAAAVANARVPVPKDIQNFILNADECDHAAGEFDGSLSEQRQREIEHAVVKYCQPAQRQLKTLKEKYKGAPKLMELIRKHTYDSVVSFR